MAEKHFAVVAVGPDRKGLLADLVDALRPIAAAVPGDPTMSMLPGGNFGTMFAVTADVESEDLQAVFTPFTDDGMAVQVHELTERTASPLDGAKYILRVRTQGRPGVMSELVRIVARHDGLVMDFGTRIGGDRISVLRVDLEDDSPTRVAALTQDLYAAAEQMGVGIKFYDTKSGEHAF